MSARKAESTESTKAPKKRSASLYDSEVSSTRGIILKIALLAILDAAVVFAAFLLFMTENWLPLVVLAITAVLINYIYLRRGAIAAKYLTPGVFFLIAFQISVLVFSFFTAFTNYSSSHNGDIKWATKSILSANFATAEDAPAYDVTWLEDSNKKPAVLLSKSEVAIDPATGEVMLDPDTFEPIITYSEIYLGVKGKIVEPADRAKVTEWSAPKGDCSAEGSDCGIALGYEGFDLLNVDALKPAQTNALLKLKFWQNADRTSFINFQDLYAASESTAVYRFDNPNGDYSNPSLTRISDGAVFKPAKDGFYRQDGVIDGEKASATGWEVWVGLDNMKTIFGDEKLREPLLKIISWTVIFAVLSVLTTFIVGLAISLLFDDARMRGKKIYRSIMILPYAFPAFLSAYVWKGLFNQGYGFINTVILGQPNAAIDLEGAANNTPWLVEGTWAKAAVLLVNLWLGFPYMFLITTGALQAIPAELTESATIDGATPGQILRQIKLPLLLVSLAPLLISSFAFNFNNFSIIYLLTGGGPTNTATGYQAGETDILITFVYKIAFSTGTGRDYGLASAFSILIFLVVGTMSLISFRRTKFLEEIN